MEICHRMTTRTPETHADREKLLVALSSVLAAVLLTGTKVAVGRQLAAKIKVEVIR